MTTIIPNINFIIVQFLNDSLSILLKDQLKVLYINNHLKISCKVISNFIGPSFIKTWNKI